MNKKYTMEFAVVTNENKEVVRIGRSVITTPKAMCKENSIKWFDDTKLIKKARMTA